MFDSHSTIDFVTRTVFLCAVAHTLLPPWEVFEDFPTAMKYYKLFLNVVSYVAVSRRSGVYASLSTKDGTQISHVSQFKMNGK